jgi:molecular chaperone GrpE (heat shock protein)
MFKFIKDIKELKEKMNSNYNNIEKLEKMTKKSTENIDTLKKKTNRHFIKQDLKTEEVLDTLIDLYDMNKLEEENENLVNTTMLLLDSIHLISNYLKKETVNIDQLNKQIKIVENKINDHLIKSKITLISSKGDRFNEKKHEVVDVSKATDDSKKHGEIKTIIERGYMYKGKVMKKAKVEAYSKQ